MAGLVERRKKMKLLVVSDNHGDRQVLKDIVEKRKNEVDAYFHCGDSELPADDPIWNAFTAVVKGNCDFDSNYPKEVTTSFKDETIYMTHGHLVDVHFGLEQLKEKAKEKNATIALFGHTHQLGCTFQQGILCLNPGSIRLPKGNHPYQAYAIIETTDKEYNVSYYDFKHHALSGLQVTFPKSI